MREIKFRITKMKLNKLGSNQHIKRRKWYHSTYLNLLILPVMLGVGLSVRHITAPISQAFIERSKVSTYTASPLPSTPSATLDATAEVEPTEGEQADRPTPLGGVGKFIERVHILESGAGQNANPYALHNVCKTQGESNEFGYGGMALMICFPSFEDAKARIERWYNEHIEHMSEPMVYCYYNLGLKTEDCPYWEKARNL